MRYMLTSMAAFAALTISLQAGAQTSAPNAAAPPAAAPPSAAAPVQEMNRMSTGGKATSERGATGSAARAHHPRHTAHHSTKKPSSATSADQSSTSSSANPTATNRMSVGGKATSGGPR